MRRVRQSLLRQVDRSVMLRRAMASVLAAVYRRRGADPGILDEAVRTSSDREAKRTAEMMMWAAAVRGRSAFPAWFPASYHIKEPQNRARSARALRHHLATHQDAPAMLWKQHILFDEPTEIDEARAFVARDIETRLRTSSTAGVDGRTAIPGDVQLGLLARATRAMEARTIRPFLVSGTLLGAVRDGKLMDHDYDIDLGVLPGEADALAIGDALSSAGFDVKVQEYKVVATDASGFSVDVFLHYERDDLLWHGTEIHEWWNTPFDIVRGDLQGVPVWIPDDPERYLDENYGTWDRPIAFYNFSFDTPNRVYRQTFHALLYLHKRLVTALESNDRWTVESAARELRDEFDVDVTASLQPTGLLRSGCDVAPRARR